MSTSPELVGSRRRLFKASTSFCFSSTINDLLPVLSVRIETPHQSYLSDSDTAAYDHPFEHLRFRHQLTPMDHDHPNGRSCRQKCSRKRQLSCHEEEVGHPSSCSDTPTAACTVGFLCANVKKHEDVCKFFKCAPETY